MFAVRHGWLAGRLRQPVRGGTYVREPPQDLERRPRYGESDVARRSTRIFCTAPGVLRRRGGPKRANASLASSRFTVRTGVKKRVKLRAIARLLLHRVNQHRFTPFMEGPAIGCR